jgi:ABC-type Fe3+/spermidine/putrescine transport system ATPase subunit
VELDGDGVVRAVAAVAPVAGSRVRIALRPECLTVGRTAGAPETNHVAGTVERRKFLGNLAHYFVRTGGGRLIMVETPARGDQVKVADAVYVTWRPEDGLVFVDDGQGHPDVTGESPPPSGTAATDGGPR